MNRLSTMTAGIGGWALCLGHGHPECLAKLIKAGDHIPLTLKRQGQRLLILGHPIPVSPAFPVTLAGYLCRIAILPPIDGLMDRDLGPWAPGSSAIPSTLS